LEIHSSSPWGEKTTLGIVELLVSSGNRIWLREWNFDAKGQDLASAVFAKVGSLVLVRKSLKGKTKGAQCFDKPPVVLPVFFDLVASILPNFREVLAIFDPEIAISPREAVDIGFFASDSQEQGGGEKPQRASHRTTTLLGMSVLTVPSEINFQN
jgi:hypothetical protein